MTVMTPEEVVRLLNALRGAGWTTREGWVYGPRGTMAELQSAVASGPPFLPRTNERVERLRSQGGFDDVADAQSLVDVLKQLS